jgi:hypothetical protein
MVNSTALDTLDIFLRSPTPSNASALIDIPALHDLLAYKFSLGRELSAEVFDICTWVADRARAVLSWLKKDTRPIPLIAGGSLEKSWTEAS